MCSQSAGSSAWASITSSRMSLGCGLVYRMRSMPSTCIDPPQQVGEPDPRFFRQVPPVAVHVLAEQGQLHHAFGGLALGFGDQQVGIAALFASPGATARCSTSRRSCSPGRSGASPGTAARGCDGQVSGELLELEVALGGQRIRVQELGEAMDLPGTESDVDERELAEDLVLDRLGPAAADPDDALGVLVLQPFRFMEVRDEAVVGVLADRAGVEEDQVGVAALFGLVVTERREHAFHALGIVRVHLAPESGDVELLHRCRGYRHPEGSEVAQTRAGMTTGATEASSPAASSPSSRSCCSCWASLTA